MPWIYNCSRSAVQAGEHPSADNAILIQITDICSLPPTPKVKFSKAFHFEFNDVESRESEEGITNQQAKQIAAILNEAMEFGYDVVVHCHAGLCRSGAVAEVGVMLGFEDLKTKRIPNLLVKIKLLEELGMGINSGTSMFAG